IQTLWSVAAMDSFVRFSLRRHPGERMLAFRLLGLGDVVSLLDPRLVGELFAGDGEVLRAGEMNRQVFGVLGPNSVLLLDGEPHLRARRLLLPPFHGPAITRHERLVEEITRSEIERWPVGGRLALLPRMRAIAMEVILRAVIGVRDPHRRQQLTRLLPAFARGGVFGLLLQTRFPWLADGPVAARTPWARDRARAELLLEEEIAEHRAHPENRTDVLAQLLAARDQNGEPLTDRELRDHLLTLLGAGHDTTAAALSWCFHHLLRHPEALTRATNHPDDHAYLTAVVNESMRLRPVADSVARKLATPLQIGGYRLPAGTIVAAPINAIHHSPAIHPNPYAFNPDRFLGQRPAPHTFIPFGGGQRRCIGASFALMELTTVLRTVLTRVQLKPLNPRHERPNRTRSVAITPKRGVPVTVVRRL
ncbi:MAG TPA: cytochrome P450, partial [Solirubrobacteraceae bacterium]|nr:cytochrome P450 [Solirubrobacteraceae bacterium]